jgi:ankyrin repeat protein
MELFLKFLPVIIVVLAIFAAREGYSIFKYTRQSRLHEAARSGRMDMVRKYLQTGHTVNARDPRFGLTPLHYAVRNGHVEIAKLLIRGGAGLDDLSVHGITAGQWAAEYLSAADLEELRRLSARFRQEHQAQDLYSR